MAKPNLPISVEDEVLANLRRQPLGVGERGGQGGAGTVADLNLPLDFLRRVADRVIQQTFRERHRVVARGPGDPALEHSPPAPPASIDAPLPPWIEVAAEAPAPDHGWRECRAGARGFRASIDDGDNWPLNVSSDARHAGAVKLVTSRLAVDGVEKTFAKAAAMVGGDIAVLRAIGLPTDLMPRAGAPPVPTVRGFAVATESDAASTLRVQLTGPGYYAGEGDGGSLDIMRQLVASCPGVTIIASVQREHLAGVLASARSWTPAPGTRLKIIPHAAKLSQWAQDNAKPGTCDGRPLLLAPRWAGRGEDGGFFIPGETLVMHGLKAAGARVHQSPLLFEGGNLMLIREPSGRRVLLIGEAEVWRNMALGLYRERVLEYFKLEFAADSCIILPAASFHIDLEVSARVHDGHTIAFIPDSLAAVRAIASIAAKRLGEVGLMPDFPSCIAASEAGKLPEIFERLGAAVGHHAIAPGVFPMSFARHFRAGDTDSGVGNLQRILFTLDWLAAELNLQAPEDRHAAAYLRSLRRVEADRRVIHRHLKQLGWRIIPVPALSSESLSLNPINGLHLADRILMSAYGGLFAPLDAAAAKCIERECPGVTVQHILTAETQRRGGGLHCAVGRLG